MHTSPLQGVIDHLRRLTDPNRSRELCDADLLEGFHLRREESAFTLLVQRHGPLVLNVCRRILGDVHEAEDAFQATFLVLVRKADTIHQQQSLAGWLHRVALRLALRARAQLARRQRCEREVIPQTMSDNSFEVLAAGELRTALDEEIERLPDKYRMPLVLCYLAEKTHEQAAHELGWPKSSVTARLAKARELLQQRLTRRGFTAPAGVVAMLLTEATANAAFPAVLTLSTVRLAMSALLGKPLAGTAAIALADSVAKGVGLTKWLAGLTLVTALGVAAIGPLCMKNGSPTEKPAPAAKPQQAEPRKPRLDWQGDPLPDGVLARVGSGRMRHFAIYFSPTLAFTPDGKALVSGGSGSLRMWDVATGKLRRRFVFDGATDRCFDFVFRGDTLIALSGKEDKGILTVQVFDRTNGKLRRKVALPDHNLVANPALSRDGKQLAYALEKNSVRIYDCETGRETRRISLRGNWASGLAFAPDGKTIAVSDNTDTVCCYNVDNGKSVCELRHDRDVVSELVFSPDGQFFATVTNRKANQTFAAEISIWRKGREGKVIHRLKMPSGMVFHPAFSPDGKLLAAGGFHEEILLWDVSTGKEIRRYSAPNGITSLVFSGDGKRLATMTGVGTIQLRETDTGILLPASADRDFDIIHGFRFRSEGRQLIGIAGRYRAWNVQTGREIPRFFADSLRPLSYDYFSDCLSPDETLFVDADENGTIHLRETTTGRDVQLLKGHTKKIACVTFSPDGRFLFSASDDDTIRVWEVKSGRCRHELKDGGPRLHAMIASPDGRWLATACDGGQPDQKIILWDLVSGRRKARIPARRSGFLYQLAFSPDSRFLATVVGRGRFEPGEVTLWTVPDGKVWRSLEGHKVSVLRLAYSADGRMVATGDYAGTLLLWELASGRQRHAFKGHTCPFSALAFSPNGRLLAAASSEAPAYFWDVIGSLENGAHALSADDLRHCWSDLRSDDAALAFQSIRRLAAVPAQTLPLLRQHLKPVPTPDPKQVRQRVEMLDSDDFPTRQKATEELEKQADASASLLRQIMANEKPTLEVRRTLQQILEGIESKPETLRAVRAVEVLEWMATPDAVRLIGELAKGTAEARLTREASAAKRRLSH